MRTLPFSEKATFAPAGKICWAVACGAGPNTGATAVAAAAATTVARTVRRLESTMDNLPLSQHAPLRATGPQLSGLRDTSWNLSAVSLYHRPTQLGAAIDQ